MLFPALNNPAQTPPTAATPRWGCACMPQLGRRAFTGAFTGLTGLALLGASAPALAVVPECKRSMATKLVPAGQIEAQAQQQYTQMVREADSQRALAPPDHPQVQRLRYIASRIVPYTSDCNPSAANWKWEINLLGSKQVNAFCMPGGKIAFYNGILAQLKLSDDEVAVVMGHEVAHALLEHARERMAKSMGTSMGLRIGAAVLGLGGVGDMAAQGLASLATLKFGRSDESEADALGLILASKAGYDPRAGVTLWQKMSALTAGKAPPQWLSTHPAGATRIKEIQGRLPKVLPSFETAGRPDRRFEVATAV